MKMKTKAKREHQIDWVMWTLTLVWEGTSNLVLKIDFNKLHQIRVWWLVQDRKRSYLIGYIKKVRIWERKRISSNSKTNKN